jgi:hypothetical protein
MTDDENTAFELSDDEGTVFQLSDDNDDDIQTCPTAASAAAPEDDESSLTVNKDGIVKLAWRDESSGQDGTRLPPRELRVAAWYL